MTITPAEFAAQRSPRRGRANPERMDRPVWEWLVRSELDAFAATQRFDGPSPFDAGPGWCFVRFGMTETPLSDGRVVHIAGEHEDHYDPDFYIYNDVVVRHPDNSVEILGYPEDVFPPTDFHTATLVDGGIVILGCLGYPNQRRPGTTPVYLLDTTSFAVESLPSHGSGPGWIHRHRAELDPSGRSIVVRRGLVLTELPGGDTELVPNVDDWRYEFATGTWSRCTHRPFQLWSFRREDGGQLMLFEMSTLALAERPQLSGEEPVAELDALVEQHSAELRAAGRCFDSATYEARFVPPIDHLSIELFVDDEDSGSEAASEVEAERATTSDAAWIRIGDALVRYNEGFSAIHVTIEGELADDDARRLREDLLAKLTRLEGAACEAVAVRRQP